MHLFGLPAEIVARERWKREEKIKIKILKYQTNVFKKH